jgi:molybdopterin/thiamine biosynthesis adenylyltransferase
VEGAPVEGASAEGAPVEGATDVSPARDPLDAVAVPDVYARNWLFIPAELQARLSETTLVTAGTGLGSVVATLAARVGFKRFVLVDGDVVEVSNLNRQAFSRPHVGQNKAAATAEIIRAIIPDASVESVPRFLTDADVGAIVRRGELIVNTIDLDNLAFLKLNQAAREAKKTVLFPINLGWGGALLVFPPEGMSLDDYLGLGPGQAGTEEVATQLIQRILQGLPGGIPPYLAALLPRFQTRDTSSWPYDPQLGVATHLSAALSVRAAVALVAGESLRAAPEVMWLDAMAASTPLSAPALAEVSEVDAPSGDQRASGGDAPLADIATPGSPSSAVATAPTEITEVTEVSIEVVEVSVEASEDRTPKERDVIAQDVIASEQGEKP